MTLYREAMEQKLRERHDPSFERELVLVESQEDLRLGDMVAEGVFVTWLYIDYSKPHDLANPPRPYRCKFSQVVEETDSETGNRRIYDGKEVELSLSFPLTVARGVLRPSTTRSSYQFPKGYGQHEVDVNV